jgi:bacteriocin biosynthesis cyclodehydratase domain-containing protein
MMGRNASAEPLTVQIVADGPFGLATATWLAGLLTAAGHRGQLAPDDAPVATVLAAGDLAVRISWRDVHAEFDHFAAAAAHIGRPWIPVAMAHPWIRIGPAIVPGVPPCHACYQARVRQHQGPSAWWQDELQRRYAFDPAAGVAGYPPHAAAAAAALALDMIGASPAGRVQPGHVALLDYRSSEIHRWPVTAVQRCACDPAVTADPTAHSQPDRTRRLRRLALRPDQGAPA